MPITSPTAYSRLQIGLHWLIALIVLFQLVFGEAMETYVDSLSEGKSLSGMDMFLGNLHYWFGISLLLLIAVRLFVRFAHGVPAPLAAESMASKAAGVLHWVFYALLIIVPVSGLLAFYFDEPFADFHTLSKPVFIVLISIHSVAALVHHFWLKDRTLMRMVSSKG